MMEAQKRSGTGSKVWKLTDLLPVLEALNGLRYGSVEIFVQDSRLVQIDRREKIRDFKNGTQESPTG
jgi:hypothetical protein